MATKTETIWVFSWDEVSTDVLEYEVEVPDQGLTPRQTLVLADDAISQQVGDQEGIYDRSIYDKMVNGHQVWVLAGRFGRDAKTRLYWCPTSDACAEEAAHLDADTDTSV